MVSPPQLNVRMRRVCLELRRLRRAANLTLKQVARQVGHAPGTLSKMETRGTGLSRQPFVIMDYELLPSLVLLENKSSDLYLEEEADVDAYNSAWQGIEAVALTPVDSTELILRIGAGLK